LREVIALRTGVPQPSFSSVFSPQRSTFGTLYTLEPTDFLVDGHARDTTLTGGELVDALPVPLMESTDPAGRILAATSYTSVAHRPAPRTVLGRGLGGPRERGRGDVPDPRLPGERRHRRRRAAAGGELPPPPRRMAPVVVRGRHPPPQGRPRPRLPQVPAGPVRHARRERPEARAGGHRRTHPRRESGGRQEPLGAVERALLPQRVVGGPLRHQFGIRPRTPTAT